LDAQKEPIRNEIEEIHRRYAKRSNAGQDNLYNPVLPCNALWRAETHVEMAALLNLWLGPERNLGDCIVAEIGCGSGSNLLEMIRFGADPSNMLANELLPHRVTSARARLPASVKFFPGDMREAEIAPGSVDLVLQFTVLSSVLDPVVRRAVAETAWSWLKPGGAFLSYDFVYDNPRNPDVRKVTVQELRGIFPDALFDVRRVTLAPPVARRIAGLSPELFRFLNLFPFLRSHALCLIRKPT